MTKGSGNTIAESREVHNFNKICVRVSAELIITQSDRESLVIEAEDNVISYIVSEVRNETLVLELNNNRWQTIQPTERIKFCVEMKQVAGLQTAGACIINTNGINTVCLDLEVSGSCQIVISTLDAKTLKAKSSGSAKIDLAAGQVDNQEIQLCGSSEYNAPKLESKAVNLDISGSGEATVLVRDALYARISGSGKVNFYGTPSVTKHMSGSGELKRLGNVEY